jgi:hypothetical protein
MTQAAAEADAAHRTEVREVVPGQRG